MANQRVNIRELILETLLLITRDKEYSHLALKSVLDKYRFLDKKDRSFIARVVNGTIERKIEIDYVLDQFSKVKVKKMKPVIRVILESAVFQLFYMDHVPDSAICNEAVRLADKRGFHNLKGYVNGVLRNISRNKDDIKYKDLSVTYSLPQWLISLWEENYDQKTIEKMGAYFLQRSPLSIRVNTVKLTKEELMEKLTKEGVSYEEVADFPEALIIKGVDYLEKLESFKAGDFQVQDLSSMTVAKLANPKIDDYCIDVCAAPGGKSTHLGELLKESGKVEARDISEYKVSLLEENIKRGGYPNVTARVWDARMLDEQQKEQADIVLADLPCSGLGVIGRKADLKYRVEPADLKSLAALQREILTVVKEYVKPGGTLVYSTCTINRSENEENASWFEKENPEFTKTYEKQRLPGIDLGDGFYIAIFKRNKI